MGLKTVHEQEEVSTNRAWAPKMMATLSSIKEISQSCLDTIGQTRAMGEKMSHMLMG